jgi:hypothetical protein
MAVRAATTTTEPGATASSYQSGSVIESPRRANSPMAPGDARDGAGERGKHLPQPRVVC